jgi:LPS-assembly lipoprotein
MSSPVKKIHDKTPATRHFTSRSSPLPAGFRPMYGTAATHRQMTAEQGLDQVDIALIPNAEGVYLRNELIDRFYQNGYPAQTALYDPDGRLKSVQTESDFDVTVESEATRRQLTLSSSLQLTDIKTGAMVLNRPLKTVTSYDVIGSQFATRIAEEDARKAALRDIARQAEMQISLFLGR